MPPRDPIAAVLGQRGLLSRAFAGYEDRPQQLQMAKLVRRTLDERRYAVIEAGTGTGKTLAYLVPAVLSGRKVVIATATKTLQDQIVQKDIPLLRKAASLDFQVTVMKGRGNYLCLSRLDAAEDDPHRLFSSAKERRVFETIRSWAQTTSDGDRAELDLPEGAALWKDLSVSSETCTGKTCARYEDCFVTRMRKRAAESDLVVVNHHLFFADLALRTAKGVPGAEVIPRYDAVVFDEAHALEDVATEFFGLSVSTFRVEELLRDTERAFDEGDAALSRIAPLMGKVARVAEHLFSEVGRMFATGGQASVRLAPPHRARLAGPSDELATVLAALKGAISSAEGAPAEALARRAGEIGAELRFLVEAKDPSFVYWAETRGRGRFLRAAPIDVAEELRERLFPAVDTAVFTSATLSTQGNFDYVKRRLGLSDGQGNDVYAVDTLRVDSPFNFRVQAALYAPVHLPEPQAPDFIHAAAEEIFALCKITSGRAFALFTSLRNMTEAHRLLKDRLPYRVLLQGEAPKQALIAQFRERPSVLFAAQSFWEGVDIAGDALCLVIIDKLPFASPADPVIAARVDLLKSLGREPFYEYQVPQAALALRQGFGRLIRSRKDRGVVAVLDRRLSTKAYGRAFLETLPPCPKEQVLSGIAGWWARAGA